MKSIMIGLLFAVSLWGFDWADSAGGDVSSKADKSKVYTRVQIDGNLSLKLGKEVGDGLEGNGTVANSLKIKLSSDENNSLKFGADQGLYVTAKKPSLDNAKLWEKSTSYKANEIFFFEAINGSLDKVGKKLKAPHGYLGRYLIDYTTPDTPLTVVEIAKINTISNGGSIFRDAVANDVDINRWTGGNVRASWSIVGRIKK